jgi:hypothetical protein
MYLSNFYTNSERFYLSLIYKYGMFLFFFFLLISIIALQNFIFRNVYGTFLSGSTLDKCKFFNLSGAYWNFLRFSMFVYNHYMSILLFNQLDSFIVYKDIHLLYTERIFQAVHLIRVNLSNFSITFLKFSAYVYDHNMNHVFTTMSIFKTSTEFVCNMIIFIFRKS